MPDCSWCAEPCQSWVKLGPGAYCWPDCAKEAQAAAERSERTQRFHEALREAVAPVAARRLFERPRRRFARLKVALARMDYLKMTPMGLWRRK